MLIVMYLALGLILAAASIDAARENVLRGNRLQDRHVQNELEKQLCDIAEHRDAADSDEGQCIN